MLVLAAFIFKPYISASLTGIVFAYIFFPLFRWINRKIKMPSLSAFMVSIIVILLVTVPLSFVMYQMSKEVTVGYTVIRQKILRGAIIENFEDIGILGKAANSIKEFISQPEPKYYIQENLQKIADYLVNTIITFIFSLPSRLIDIFVVFFVMFFCLKDGSTFILEFEKKLPIDAAHKRIIFRKVSEVTKGIVYGVFVIAVIEGILGALTFQLAGFSSVILWGAVITITAIIPIIGASIIWIPAAIFSVMNGWTPSTAWLVIGGVIISSIDTFVKPKIIGDQSAVHPIIIFLGFLGGIHIFGFIGFVIGPLILALLLTFIELIYGDMK